MKRPRHEWYLLSIAIFLIAGCTLAEWGQIRDDALTLAPGIVDQVLQDPTSPVGAITALVTYVAGLFTKSAARGFGKSARWVATKVKR